MSILLKFPFSNQGQEHIQNVLQDTRNTLHQRIKRYKSTKNLKKMQEFLTDLYYNKTFNQTSLITDYHTILEQELSKNLADRINNFNFTNAKSNYSHQHASIGTVQAYSERLDNSLKILQNSLQSVQNATTKAKMQQIEQNIINLQNTVKAFQSHVKNNNPITKFAWGNAYLAGDIGKSAANLVRTMDIYNSLIRSGTDMNMTNIGDGFEESLTEALKRFYGSALIDCFQTGNDYTSRGVYQGSALGGIQYSLSGDGLDLSNFINQIIAEDKDANRNQTFKIDKNGYTYTYHPGSKTKAKMDVQGRFAFGDLRISAKSWTQGSRSLGETSISAGMIRAVGPNIMKYYTLSMLNPKNDQFGYGKNVSWISKEIGHDLAKLSILSDVAMGLNQGDAGRAEVLIIDTGNSIVVRDISQIIETIYRGKKIADYKETEIESDILKRYELMKNITSERSNTYFGLTIITVLDKMKVSINLKENMLIKN